LTFQKCHLQFLHFGILLRNHFLDNLIYRNLMQTLFLTVCFTFFSFRDSFSSVNAQILAFNSWFSNLPSNIWILVCKCQFPSKIMQSFPEIATIPPKPPFSNQFRFVVNV
jgi:hypothetical protein